MDVWLEPVIVPSVVPSSLSSIDSLIPGPVTVQDSTFSAVHETVVLSPRFTKGGLAEISMIAGGSTSSLSLIFSHPRSSG